jgi:hypothetical protein
VLKDRALEILAFTLTSLSLIMAPLSPAFAGNEDPGSENEVDLFDDDVERNPRGWSRLQISGGVTWMDADGIFSVGLSDRPPVTVINFDRAGLKESDSSHWLSATWRSAKSRWGIWFANWRYDVNGSRTWQDAIQLPERGDIPVGATVQTDFDANWYVLEATWSFIQTDAFDSGIGFGFHTVDLDTTLNAEVELGDGRIEVVRGNLDTLAPLPNVMAYLYWNPPGRWDFEARYGWFGLSYDKYDGRLTNSHIKVNFALSQRLSIGVGYQYVHLDVDVEEKRYTQIYDIDFDGPVAMLRFRF